MHTKTDRETLLRYAEGQRFLFLQEQCLNLTKKALDPIIRRYGLNHSQYVILMIINYAELTGEKAISTDISYILGREKHTITPQVESLVKRGYVRRGEDQADRRVIVLMLTDEGRRLIREVQPQTFSIVADIPLGDAAERRTAFGNLEVFRRSFAKLAGLDPKLYSGAYDRLLVRGEDKLLEMAEQREKEEGDADDHDR